MSKHGVLFFKAKTLQTKCTIEKVRELVNKNESRLKSPVKKSHRKKSHRKKSLMEKIP